MNNQYRVGKPKEGMNTLVARFSFTLFDKSVEKIKMLRRQGGVGRSDSGAHQRRFSPRR